MTAGIDYLYFTVHLSQNLYVAQDVAHCGAVDAIGSNLSTINIALSEAISLMRDEIKEKIWWVLASVD